MPEQVLVYSRFPKSLMVRIGQRFDLLDAAGKPPNEVFTADQLEGLRAMITAGGTPLPAAMMDMMPKLGAIVCYGTGYDGVDVASAASRGIAVGHSPRCQCGFGRRHRRDPDAGGDAAVVAGRRICPKRQLGRGKAIADDGSAARAARSPHRRLWHGRDRPQDRQPGGGVRG